MSEPFIYKGLGRHLCYSQYLQTSAVHFVLRNDYAAMCQPDVGDTKRVEQCNFAKVRPCDRIVGLQGCYGLTKVQASKKLKGAPRSL